MPWQAPSGHQAEKPSAVGQAVQEGAKERGCFRGSRKSVAACEGQVSRLFCARMGVGAACSVSKIQFWSVSVFVGELSSSRATRVHGLAAFVPALALCLVACVLGLCRGVCLRLCVLHVNVGSSSG